MYWKNKGILLIYIWGISLLIDNGFCQEFQLSTHVEKQFILLRWTQVEGAKGYNIYRKTEAGSYQKINTSLITKKTGNDILNVLKVTHPEWPVISKALKITSPTQIHDDPPGVTKQEQEEVESRRVIREALCLLYYRFALAMGQAHQDTKIQNGVNYTYQIASVDAKNVETFQTPEKFVTAGDIVTLIAPTNVQAQSGDKKVLITWDEVLTVSGYDVFRDTNPGGTFTNCLNGLFPVMVKISQDLQGDSLKPPVLGFIDTTVTNGKTYYYKIAARDLYGKSGPKSTAAKANPRDMTPPISPQTVNVDPLKDALRISWRSVTKDVSGRNENVAGYYIYRYPDFDSAMADKQGTMLGFVKQPALKVIGKQKPPPAPPGTTEWVLEEVQIYFTDKDPSLEKEKVYWYRISCQDKATPANISVKSAAASGYVKDLSPPAKPVILNPVGYDNYIELSWMPNQEPDCAGYLIYRGICDNCSTLVEADGNVKIYKKAPCQLSLLVDIPKPDSVEYKDTSIPKASPICYRYAIKAYDKSQNLSVMSDSVCQRLRDTTGPPEPIIVGLKARDRALRIEWVASPVQDLAGFYVERAEAENGNYKQVSDPLKLPEQVDCQIILANKIKRDALYSFTDKKVESKKNYWYRVRAVDLDGNPGKKASASRSTFAFQMQNLQQPANLSVQMEKANCAVKLNWTPPYDPANLGFAVFRSLQKDKGYQQLNPIIKGNEFIDQTVVSGMRYWYRVQYFDTKGNRSIPSKSISIVIPD